MSFLLTTGTGFVYLVHKEGQYLFKAVCVLFGTLPHDGKQDLFHIWLQLCTARANLLHAALLDSGGVQRCARWPVDRLTQ